MFVYFTTNWTARVQGEGWRAVDCEHCGRHFEYIIVVEGVGSAGSAYGSDDAGSKKRAKRYAEEDLKYQLETAVVPTFCPGCGRYQTDMLDLLTKNRFPLFFRPSWIPRIVEAGLIAFGAVGLIALMASPFATDSVALGMGCLFFSPFALIYSIRAVVCAIQLFRRWTFDPYRGKTAEERMAFANRYTVPAKPMAQPVLTPMYDEGPQRRAAPILSPVYEDDPPLPHALRPHTDGPADEA